MAKKHRNGLKPWATAMDNGIDTPFTQIGQSLLKHPSFKSLNNATKLVYILMMCACAGKLSFTFQRGYYEKYGFNKTTVTRAIKELEKKGFVSYTSGKNTRTPNVFTFKFDWKNR